MKQIKKSVQACIEQINQAKIDFVSTLSFGDLQRCLSMHADIPNGYLHLSIEDSESKDQITLKIIVVDKKTEDPLLTVEQYFFKPGYHIVSDGDREYGKMAEEWFTFLFGQDLTDLDVPLSSKDITLCFNGVRKFYENYL